MDVLTPPWRYGPFRESQLGFIIVAAQQTYVAEVNGTFVWQGDMWDSYTDPDNGQNIKAYDYQVRVRPSSSSGCNRLYHE